jgi:hypothetical protein
VFTLETFLSCNYYTHTGEETVDESLQQGAYEDSIKTRKDLEQVEVENPVRHGCLSKPTGGGRDQSSKWWRIC